MSEERIRWSQKSLDELVAFYRTQIEPDLRAAGVDLDGPPTYQTLADHGYSGLAYALREHHDRTVHAFLVEDVGLEPRESDGYRWGIDAEETIDAAESYFSRIAKSEEIAASTLATKRSKLATYLRTYADVHGDAAFMGRLRDPEEQPDETDRVFDTVTELKNRLETNEAVLSYASVVAQWYTYLDDLGHAEYDASNRLFEDLNMEADGETKPALTSNAVQSLVEATGDDEERLLVLAVCAWGLRRGEVASLHTGQLVLEGDDPHVTFDEERKNGPGSVAIIYGLGDLERRLAELGERERWDGYLFPAEGGRGHVHPDTVTNRFKRIAERADVRLLPAQRTPHGGRRYWYQVYTDVVEEVSVLVDEVAEEQGASDPETVLQEYLDEESLRDLRRERMRERLADAFEE